MDASNKLKFDTMSEAELEPVLKLLQGGNPDVIALKEGISKEQLLKIRDDLLTQAERERAKAIDVPSNNVGRNAPCPCGSEKKYKHCCLSKHKAADQTKNMTQANNFIKKERAQEKLIKQIEKAFGLVASGKYNQAIHLALKLIKVYPNEDRLHDIAATGYLYAGECEKAIEICKCRLKVAESKKAYFIKHGRYRDAEIDKPALSYYYPPITWLQKYWIALKAKDYQALYPAVPNPKIVALVNKLQTADDPDQFPAKHSQGLELRGLIRQLQLVARRGVIGAGIGLAGPLARCRLRLAGFNGLLRRSPAVSIDFDAHFTPSLVTRFLYRPTFDGLDTAGVSREVHSENRRLRTTAQFNTSTSPLPVTMPETTRPELRFSTGILSPRPPSASALPRIETLSPLIDATIETDFPRLTNCSRLKRPACRVWPA